VVLRQFFAALRGRKPMTRPDRRQEAPKRHESRGHQRFRPHPDPAVLAVEGARFDCIIEDLSSSGVQLRTEATPALGAPATLIHSEIGQISGAVIRCEPGMVALNFDVSDQSVTFVLKTLTRDLQNET